MVMNVGTLLSLKPPFPVSHPSPTSSDDDGEIHLLTQTPTYIPEDGKGEGPSRYGRGEDRDLNLFPYHATGLCLMLTNSSKTRRSFCQRMEQHREGIVQRGKLI